MIIPYSRRKLALFAGPLLFAVAIWTSGSNSQWTMIALLSWMLIWWMTQVVPIGITSLLPMLLFPILEIQTLSAVSANYANPIIYLFFGGFVLGIGIEKWDLHRRVALNILRRSGTSPAKVVLGGMLATAVLSTLISNTATSIMMLPIGMSIISLLSETDESAANRLAVPLLLGIAYAANIGGMATLIGTPPNLVLAGLINENGLPEISFVDWLIFALPLTILLFIVAFWFLKKQYLTKQSDDIPGISALLKRELLKLGKMSAAEKRTAIMVALAAFAWIFRRPISEIPGLENISDTGIALLVAFLLFAIPSGTKTGEPLLIWRDMDRMPWGILLLFGGGISVANGMDATGIVESAGNWIAGANWSILWGLIVVITAFSVFLTEAMSNVALVSVFIPVSFVVAAQTGISELTLAVPLTLGASCAFMFPISTPPNAVVYSSGKIPMTAMARTGFVINVLCILIIATYSYLFGF